jgi:hypothetical protein
MNKFLLFLAFAIFALAACSEDKPPPSHSELCAKKPITKECLVGRWALEEVEGGNSQCNPNKGIINSLKLYANGEFSFNGGYEAAVFETNGNWELNEAVMKINCIIGDCNPDINYPIDATIEIRNSKLRIATQGYTGFLQCSVGSLYTTFTEVYSWQSAN